MGDKTHYCLWLGLEKSLAQDLHGLIQHLAARYGTHAFIPHATLLTRIDITLSELEKLAAKLSEATPRFQVNSLGLAYTEEYYRNFFIQLPLTKELEVLYEASKKRFQSPETAPYQPHLSLLYGNLSANEKAKLKLELENRYPTSLEFDHLMVCDASSDILDWRITKRIELAQ